MYTLSVEKMISTAHQLRDYNGPCANIHGHNWKVNVEVQTKVVDNIGIAIDFVTLDGLLWEVIGPFDHQLINSIAPFDKLNPTAENLVKFIYDQLRSILTDKVSVRKVSVWETDEYMASYEQ